ncbi:hypothetical protein [Halostagnicola sp. A56]|nr:hypothetical protein [Halostagnicola sp. A56]
MSSGRLESVIAAHLRRPTLAVVIARGRRCLLIGSSVGRDV